MIARFALALAALGALESEAAAGNCSYTPGQAAAFVACMYSELEAVQVELGATQADLASANATITAQQATIATLQGQVAANAVMVSNVQGQVSAIQADYLTGSDLAGYATTADLAGYAPSAVVAGLQVQVADIEADYLTSADLASYVTQAELTGYATMADLGAYATTAEVVGMQGQLALLQGQVFTIQSDYLTSSDLGGYATTTDLGALQSQLDDVDLRVSDLEALHGQLVAFVTSVQYPISAIGGVLGADLICQSRASAAGLSGTYMAWLGDGATGPADRFTLSDSPYVLVDGTTLASDWFDLTDGVLTNALNVDEYGALSSATTAWTGVNTDGTTNSDHCGGWGNPIGIAGTGDVHSTSSDWTFGMVGNCGSARSLYCFEQ
ncbi:MAG: hypothetical protein KC621_24175 [Myxococcales bacterium]|nr:hypothetical protein [Myxococcales bacterium]